MKSSTDRLRKRTVPTLNRGTSYNLVTTSHDPFLISFALMADVYPPPDEKVAVLGAASTVIRDTAKREKRGARYYLAKRPGTRSSLYRRSKY